MSADGPVPRNYSAGHIQLVSLEEAVRKRPVMYFGRQRDDLELPGAIVRAVVGDAISTQGQSEVRVKVIIESDRRFTVVDTVCNAEFDGVDSPGPGYFDSLIPKCRWCLAAAAAVSTRTVIEIRTADRTWSQELAGTSPVGPPRTWRTP